MNHSLKDMQHAFMQGLIHRDKIPETLVDGDSNYAKEHFQIYQNNATLLLVDVLKNAFPAVYSLVGDDFFRMAGKAFLQENLPKSFDLFTYGAGFSAFLAAFKPAASLPYLADVAALDWARQQAYHAPQATAFDAQDFATAIADGVDVTLQLAPSAQLIASDYPVLKIWSVADGSSDDDISLDDGAEYGLVIRPELEVTMLALDADEYTWLNALRQNTSFHQAAAHVAASLQDILTKHLMLGTFQSFRKNGDLT